METTFPTTLFQAVAHVTPEFLADYGDHRAAALLLGEAQRDLRHKHPDCKILAQNCGRMPELEEERRLKGLPNSDHAIFRARFRVQLP